MIPDDIIKIIKERLDAIDAAVNSQLAREVQLGANKIKNSMIVALNIDDYELVRVVAATGDLSIPELIMDSRYRSHVFNVVGSTVIPESEVQIW